MNKKPDNSLIKEIARSYIDSELSKISHLKTHKLPKFVKEICVDLASYLREKKEIWDKEDLLSLRIEIISISEILNLFLRSTDIKSSWWAFPLIQQCYEICEIDLSKRNILIIHSSEIDDYGVYPNIIDHLPYNLSGKSKYTPVDIFTVPSEAGHDISSIALIGHEVGHIYWHINHSNIEQVIRKHLKEAEKYIQLDLFKKDEFIKKRDRFASHIEEYLCDLAGSYLLGPAFEIAFLKFFCSLPSRRDIGGDKHPSEQNRIEKSFERLRSFNLVSKEVKSTLSQIIDLLANLIDKENSDKSEEDMIIWQLVLEILKNSSIKSFQEKWNLEKIWEKVKTELDAFRPPFETVSNKRPEVISPIEAITAAVIYYYSDFFYKSNEYFMNSICDEDTKIKTIRETLIKHIKYTISLYNFVNSAHQIYKKDFKPTVNKTTLWSWREFTSGGKLNPLIVIPTIDPNSQYGSNSIDLRLGTSFLVHKPTKYTHINPDQVGVDDNQLFNIYERVEVPVNEKFILHPHQFVLASTLEYICLPYDYYALVLGRSTWGRLGLNIATATAVQAGYRGCLTLELRNLGETPLPLTVGVRIAQLCPIPVPPEWTSRGYFAIDSKYIGPVSSEIPKIEKDNDWKLFKKLKID